MSEDNVTKLPAKKGHRFLPGNQAAKGNPGPWAGQRQFLTRTLISQLHELDPKTNREKFAIIVENLIKNATGYVVKKREGERGKTKVVEYEVPPDMEAIKYIFDRLEGRPAHSIGFGEGGGGKVTVVFEPGDEEL